MLVIRIHCLCEFVLRGSVLEIPEFRVEDILQQLSDCPGDTVRNLLVQHGKCQQCLVKEGLTWCLSCWRDEVQKMQVQEANVTIDYRNADSYKSYSDDRQCWRNMSVHGHVKSRRLRLWAERAIRWMMTFSFISTTIFTSFRQLVCGLVPRDLVSQQRVIFYKSFPVLRVYVLYRIANLDTDKILMKYRLRLPVFPSANLQQRVIFS